MTQSRTGAHEASEMQPLSWQTALGVTLLMQTVAAFLGQVLPVLAPLLTSGAGVSPQGIGYLSALTSFGTVLFLAFGGPLLARALPARAPRTLGHRAA